MSQLRDDLQNLQLGENIFKDVKFFVSGEVHEKVLELLKNGGAERMNYFADYVTHLICGQDAGETDLSDANELYEIPAVTPQWVYVCAKLKKLLNTKSFAYDPNKLFSNFTFCFSSVDKDRNALWAIVTYNGGAVQLNLDGRCTHLVTTDTSTVKYDKAELIGAIAIVTPDWIVESHKSKVLVDVQLFHPKLLAWPKVVKHESTTAITGFEPEQSEFDDKDVAVPDSTQALLDKLKQRMPWNQPPSQVEVPTTNLQQQQPMVFNQYAVKTSQVPVAPPPVTRHVVQQQFAPTQPVPLQPEQKAPEQFQQRPIPNRHQLQFRQQNQFNQLLMNQLGRLNQRNNPDAQMNHHDQHLKQVNQQQPPRTLVSTGNQQFEATRTQQHVVEHQGNQLQLIQQNNPQQQQQVDQQLLQLRQNQQQNILQHTNVPKPVTTIQQQLSHLLQQQQLMNRQIIGQNQHQLKTQQQQILQNQLIQSQEQTNLQMQQQQQTQQQSQLNQQLQLQNQQNQLAQRHNQLEQQLAQNQLNQQRRLGMGQVNQQHQFQGAIVQSQLLRQQQLVQPIEQNQLVQQQQQQQPIRQTQQLVQIQQTQLPLQNQQNSNQQFANPSPVVVNQQQFVQQQNQHFVSQSQQQQPTSFSQISQPNQFLPNQSQKQIVGNTQIVTQQQLINQKINVQQQQQQQPIMINQGQQQQQLQQSQMQTVQQFNQPTQQRAIGPPHVWQQQQSQQQQQQQINIRHPNVVQQQQQQQQQGPRVQWLPNQQQAVRQYIHLDTQTHQQLQQMSPEQRALFVAKLQKQRQLQILQSRMQQQRGGHILIRGPGPGLNPQQQMQLLQQHAKQGGGVVFQSNVQQQQPQQANVPLPQQPTNAIQQHAAPGLSPIQQNVASFNDQNQQLQRQQFRIQQLQLQREQVQQKSTPTPLLQTAPVAPVQQQTIARPVDPNVSPIDPNVQQQQQQQNQLVVNPKTKTALANMLSIRLQSGGSAMTDSIAAEPSAAGTLRLMTAQHNASLISSKRAQELIALQQRKIINALNGELIRPPPAPSAPPAIPQQQQPEPPKLQYSPRNTIPLQHRPGTYYGHNPNLKLPPDLFLLGCVFVVVELERFLDESQPGWQKKIEKHGGEIEKQYCNRVTHVICETQRHGVVMQALRDFKRCVTLYWLTDVIGRKQVLPPWTALHLPTMYWDTSPASKHLICLSGYTGTERDRIKHMIKYIGAAVTTYFTKHNTLLIVSKAEGPKYFRAKKWGTPVVNTQWLTDVMLGHFSALNQTEHIKYQQFTDPPNFSFDPLLVPNLMHAWKMPINISQESYEKVKRSASPVVLPQKSNKKMKTELLTDENDNQDDTLPFMPHRVLFSMYADTSELKKIVRQLGGSLASSHKDCTHLVMPQLMRSHKLLHCICLGTYVLPECWLRDSHAANNFLDESNYSLDTKDFNSEYKCDFAQTLSTKSRNKLFEGKYFFITPSVFPSKSVLVELIHGCGGIVERTRRTLSQIEATNVNSPYSYIILTHVNDLHLVADLLKNKKDKVRIVCTVELIFSAILRQTFEVEPYAVKVL